MEVQSSAGVGQLKAVDMLGPFPARCSPYSVLWGAEFVIKGVDCGLALGKGKKRDHESVPTLGQASCFTWMDVAGGGFSGEAHSGGPGVDYPQLDNKTFCLSQATLGYDLGLPNHPNSFLASSISICSSF